MGAFDLDDIDDKGRLVVAEDEDDKETAKPTTRRTSSVKPTKPRPTAVRRARG